MSISWLHVRESHGCPSCARFAQVETPESQAQIKALGRAACCAECLSNHEPESEPLKIATSEKHPTYVSMNQVRPSIGTDSVGDCICRAPNAAQTGN